MQVIERGPGTEEEGRKGPRRRERRREEVSNKSTWEEKGRERESKFGTTNNQYVLTVGAYPHRCLQHKR